MADGAAKMCSGIASDSASDVLGGPGGREGVAIESDDGLAAPIRPVPVGQRLHQLGQQGGVAEEDVHCGSKVRYRFDSEREREREKSKEDAPWVRRRVRRTTS